MLYLHTLRLTPSGRSQSRQKVPVAEQPQLVVTISKSDVVGGYCSVCHSTLAVYANKVSMAELQRAFLEHVEKSHPGETVRASVA